MTVTKTATQHAAIQESNAEFLAYAASKPSPVQLGTIASGSSGGPSAIVSFAQPLDVVPRWCDEVELYVQLPYTITVPADATCYVSPFGPWATLVNRLTIAGSPPWDQISLVPFYLDDIIRNVAYDPAYPGPAPFTADQFQGPWSFSIGNDSVVPGQPLTAGTYTGTMQFTARIRLQRRLSATFGMIPLGATRDRPKLALSLAPFVGPEFENNFLQDPAASGATMSLTSAGTVIAVWRSKGLDVLPPGIAPPEPTVGLGLEIDSYATGVQNAGQIVKIPHTAAMLYQYVYHILSSGQRPVNSDYFALLLTGETQNARFQYDASENNLQSYYSMIHDTYKRYLPTGVLVADMVGGRIPNLPTQTPYVGAMASDQGYAEAFGIAYTPAMETAVRFPAGTTMDTAYIRTYSFGYVEVPY
jgi:hypothetical protein